MFIPSILRTSRITPKSITTPVCMLCKCPCTHWKFGKALGSLHLLHAEQLVGLVEAGEQLLGAWPWQILGTACLSEAHHGVDASASNQEEELLQQSLNLRPVLSCKELVDLLYVVSCCLVQTFDKADCFVNNLASHVQGLKFYWKTVADVPLMENDHDLPNDVTGIGGYPGKATEHQSVIWQPSNVGSTDLGARKRDYWRIGLYLLNLRVRLWALLYRHQNKVDVMFAKDFHQVLVFMLFSQ